MASHEKVDVAIVGAGASGAVYAAVLAKAGKEVLLVEQGPDWQLSDLISSDMWGRRIRTAGFSLAYSLATALFGGFTPLVCTWLIEETGNRAAPGLWMTVAALASLVATILVYDLRPGQRPRAVPAP